MGLLSQEFLSSYNGKQPRNKGPLFEVVWLRSYCRYLPDQKRRETWAETVQRVVEHSMSLYPSDGPANQESLINEAQELFDRIFHLEVLPAGRSLWVAGTKASEKLGESLFNCSFLSMDSLSSFSELFHLLLCGCGVGFGIRKEEISQLPELTYEFDLVQHPYEYIGYTDSSTEKTNVLQIFNGVLIQVGDSKEAWVEALSTFFNTLVEKKQIGCSPVKIILVYNKVRPEGSPIKTFGGRAPGPQGLIEMFIEVSKVIKKCQGKLSSIDVMDINNHIAKNVIVGGTRRSSQIALGDPEDIQFVEAKKDLWVTKENIQRTMSNNSLSFDIKPSKEEFRSIFKSILDNGEPGFFNLEAAKSRRHSVRGFNPSLRAGTKVLTSDGVFPIEQLEGKSDIEVPNLNGEISSAICRLSSPNAPLYKIILKGGHTYYATAEHKWPVIRNGYIQKKTTTELWPGNKLKVNRRNSLEYGNKGTFEDGFFIGWLLGDGWITRRRNGKYQTGLIVGELDKESGIDIKLLTKLIELDSKAVFNKDGELNTTNRYLWDYIKDFGFDPSKQKLPSSIWTKCSEEFRRGFIDGIFSSDGSVEKDGTRISLTSSRYSLLEEISELLGFYGIKTTIIKKRPCKAAFPNGKDYDKVYMCYVLKISDLGSIRHFSSIFKLSHKRKSERLSILNETYSLMSTEIEIISISKTNLKEPVWDLTVNDNTHCFTLAHCITGNCSEILLDSRQFCNLSTVVWSSHIDDLGFLDLDKLERSVRIATRLGLRHTNITVSLPEWDYKQKRDRLLGVSGTGIMDALDAIGKDFDDPYVVAVKKRLREASRDEAKKYAFEMRIPEPLLITCLKPEGSLSQLPTVSSGIHNAYSPYFIRRIRVSRFDPVAKALEAIGVPFQVDPGKKERLVFEFPIKSPTKRSANSETALRQYQRYLSFMRNYVDHNASCTITLSEDEVPTLVEELSKDENWNDTVGCAWLPKSTTAYPLMPYEEITKEEYIRRKEAFPEDLSVIIELVNKLEKEEFETELFEEECAGGACPIR